MRTNATREGAKPMATDNQLWVPPTSSKDEERPKSDRKNGRKPIIKGTGFTEKALWDWLMLIGVLTIPVAVAFATITFSHQQTLNSQAASEKQHQTDLQIAADQQRQTILQTYLDRMGELLLANKLQVSKPNQEGSELARVRTLIVLSSLDSERKRVVIQFLYETNLITAGKSIVNLSGADLSGVNLSGMTLIGADLSGANLSEANLYEVDLSGANLGGATFSEANLKGASLRGTSLRRSQLDRADLRGADLTGAILYDVDLGFANLTGCIINPYQLVQILNLRGATMPDGSIHP